ncbi:hypothetical protein MYCTH_2301693 [Thermothelomyces thermophilus ATCC 42464]|uniref:Uncharacterized protein n=1 Tax=Thermothelomyces thermophilus (strain ATCC 42464 / BCRC 31852 / DSM 1799) TaxID=573729 RepID=G2Q9Z2_THET4|nr:uncharacterized protein MYCTH_2301693 [Thermothelomyces thermophilus ATCC 42464]AEO56596.1 hypothetical protein MYCTH_2301693 [Thermothelomyces thermophilus ATCC 42464]
MPVNQRTHSGSNSRSNSPPKTTTHTKPGTGGGARPPPPPPPPAPAPRPARNISRTVEPPDVKDAGPAGYLLLSLAIFNGYPFKDHWGFFIHTSAASKKGIFLHAAGDVRHGFTFEIKRNLDFTKTSHEPTLIKLQWVEGKYFSTDMWNRGEYVVETPGSPKCGFETIAKGVAPPGKTLNAVDDLAPSATNPPQRITQENCQTWVVKASAKLCEKEVLSRDVVNYLQQIKQ